MADIVFGIRLTADGSGYSGTVRMAAEDTERLGAAARKAGAEGVDQMEGAMRRAVVQGRLLGDMLVSTARNLAQWVTQGISASAALQEWADTSGSSVENLSRISNAAKIAGVSQDMLRVGTERLAYSLANTDEESKRSTQSLEALGIVTKDPAEAFLQLATKLNQYQDGANKAALVQDILGRGAQRLLPVLKDLAERNTIVSTTTAAQARAAEELLKQWHQVEIDIDTLRDRFSTGLVPALRSIITSWSDLTNNTQAFANTGVSIGSILLTISGAAQIAAVGFINLGKFIGFVAFAITQLTEQGGFWRTKAMFEEMDKEAMARMENVRREIAKTRAEFEAWQKLQSGGAWGMGNRSLGGWEKPDAPSRVVPLKTPKNEVSEFEKEMQTLRKMAADADLELAQLFQTERITKADRALAEFTQTDRWDQLTFAEQVTVMEMVDMISTTEQATQHVKEWGEASAEVAKQQAKERADWEKSVAESQKWTDKLIESLDTETATIGMTNAQRERYIALQRLEKDMTEGLIPSMDEYRKRLDDINAAFNRRDTKEGIQKALDDQKHAFESTYHDISNTIADSMLDAFDRSKGGWKSLLDGMKSIVERYVFRPIIQAVMAPVAGGLASIFTGGAGGGGGGAGGGGGGFDFSSLLSGGNMLANWGSVVSGASAAAATFAGNAALALGASAESSLAIATFAGTVGQFIPYVGAALAVASMLGLFDKEPSQVQGRYRIAPGTEGFEDSAYTRTPFGNIGFEDAATRYFSGAGGQVFNQLISGALNAIASRMTPEQISRTTTKLQGLQFGSFEGEYSTEEFIKRYGGEILTQVVSAALGELDPALGTLVASFKGTADEVVSFANDLLSLHDAIGGDITADVEKAWKASTQGITASIDDQRKEVLRLAATYDGSASATHALAAATTTYRNSLGQLLLEIKQVTQSVRDMFAGTRETLTTYGMKPRELYDYWRNQANAAMGELATATDPATIQRLSQRVNTDINNAFNALPEAERPAAQNALLQYLNQVDAFVSARLASLGVVATAQGTSTFATVQTALESAASGMNTAADNMNTAADKMLTAAGASVAPPPVVVVAPPRMPRTTATEVNR